MCAVTSLSWYYDFLFCPIISIYVALLLPIFLDRHAFGVCLVWWSRPLGCPCGLETATKRLRTCYRIHFAENHIRTRTHTCWSKKVSSARPQFLEYIFPRSLKKTYSRKSQKLCRWWSRNTCKIAPNLRFLRFLAFGYKRSRNRSFLTTNFIQKWKMLTTTV